MLISLCVTSQAQDGWKKINLFPGNSLLADIDMKNKFVIAVGEMGVVKHSTDDGNSWDLKEIGTNKTLSSVCIYDDNNAIAASYDGGIYKTDDAASSWSEMNIFIDEEVTSINYFGNEYGIMTGNNGFLAESFGNFEEWKRVDLDIQSNLLKSLIFDKDNAIIYGEQGTLLYKSDGADWEKIDINTYANLAGIVQINDTTAFLLSEEAVGYISRDKGKSWKNVGTLPAVFAEKIKVAFMENSLKGIRLRVYSEKSYDSQDFFSYDGETWGNVIRNEDFREYSIRDLVFDRSKGTGFAISNNGIIYNATNYLIDQYMFKMNENLTGIYNEYLDGLRIFDGTNYSVFSSHNNELYFTNNAGKHWKSVKFDLPAPKGEYFFSDASFSVNNKVYIAANDQYETEEDNITTLHEDGAFAVIDDKGNLLNYHKFEKGGGIIGLDFVNKDCGVAYSQTVCHVTTDGGNSWDIIYSPAPVSKIYEMLMSNPGVIVSRETFYETKETQIAISEDFGKNWKEKTCPYNLLKISAYDKSTILAHYKENIGTNMSKYHVVLTKDGGDTWKELDIDNFEYETNKGLSICYKIYNDKIIFVSSADGGIIYTSEDYGETWESDKCNLNDKSNIIDIAMVDNEPILVFRRLLILVPENLSDVEDISDLSEKPFSIYPNPADKILNIETNDNTEYDKVKIYSLDGKLVFDKDYLSGMSINIEDLHSGNYYLVLTDKEGKQLGQKLNIVR